MADFKNIVILTGAGISAESGIDTFRSAGGLWEQHRVEDVATPEGFARNPDLVLGFYDARREALSTVEPNPAHTALARLEREFSGNLLLVTQNVDDLHERGGSSQVLHMHGELKSALCNSCEVRSPWDAPMSAKDGQRPPCPVCQAPTLRPDVVWFGEMPYQMERIYAALSVCDLFVSIGTSGAVYPAAGFVQEARGHGAQTLELNLEPSEGSHFFSQARYGKAGELVPQWVDEFLAS
ncbi:NAD-dependent deacylase [Erythrobacter sp. SCSIO 43205]|uniref:NAD-dependent deacylase n=1 Tax=Erythrobacter sp. SCSIO 43205 TaxID=2779361 RepID=UPI001CA8FAD4|nr:NAD-dependent deacylase [Erythrobacter sp. SCSIO 43205]UAB78186.1 NAD-dependent deacylase [Erythrobacter sp. SCSIO 43205]